MRFYRILIHLHEIDYILNSKLKHELKNDMNKIFDEK